MGWREWWWGCLLNGSRDPMGCGPALILIFGLPVPEHPACLQVFLASLPGQGRRKRKQGLEGDEGVEGVEGEGAANKGARAGSGRAAE